MLLAAKSGVVQDSLRHLATHELQVVVRSCWGGLLPSADSWVLLRGCIEARWCEREGMLFVFFLFVYFTIIVFFCLVRSAISAQHVEFLGLRLTSGPPFRLSWPL